MTVSLKSMLKSLDFNEFFQGLAGISSSQSVAHAAILDNSDYELGRYPRHATRDRLPGGLESNEAKVNRFAALGWAKS